MILETPRLRIRELTSADAEFILGLVNEPSFLANIGDKEVRTLDDARRFIEGGPWSNHRDQGYGQFLVELKESGEPIGVCGVLLREALGVSDVGGAFLPRYWRQGYGFEAATAMVDYGRSTLGIDRIVGLTSKQNIASIKLLEKLGMSFERVVTMSETDPGTALYS